VTPGGPEIGPAQGRLVASPPVVWFVAPLNVISGLLLIVLVLLHSGRGGGLSDMLGGGVGATALGSTAAEKNLNRITFVVALVFAFTCVALGLLLD
jgi:preprotein translocase subunit SecG